MKRFSPPFHLFSAAGSSSATAAASATSPMMYSRSSVRLGLFFLRQINIIYHRCVFICNFGFEVRSLVWIFYSSEATKDAAVVGEVTRTVQWVEVETILSNSSPAILISGKSKTPIEDFDRHLIGEASPILNLRQFLVLRRIITTLGLSDLRSVNLMDLLRGHYRPNVSLMIKISRLLGSRRQVMV